MDLAGARKAFKPISHAVVTLATQVRSEDAESSFTHFYCPMVPGGGGDWLQAGRRAAQSLFRQRDAPLRREGASVPAAGATASRRAAREA